MGILFKYKCVHCEYSVHSSLDTDYGMMAVTEPHICLDCKEVTAVLVGIYGKTYNPYIKSSGEFTKEEIRSFYRCGDCDGENIKPWSKYNRRCPKCNHRMKQDKDAPNVNWD